MPETDFAAQLARLAPEVDEAGAKSVFERHRQPSGTPRWLLPAAVVVLIVVGVTGLVLMRGDDATAPVSPVDDALRPNDGETLIADEAYFEVVIVAETTVGFGNAALVGSTEELDSLWAGWNPGVEQPDVEFAEAVALVMTRPDNACADVVTRFEVTNRNGVSTWIPVFEERADACEDPLLSWLYVVAIDRAALGDRADIVVPAAELYDVSEQTIEYTAPDGTPDESDDAATVTLTPTDVVVPLPPEGEPELHNTAAGMFYVVNHGDGDVSVIQATIDLISPVDPDTTNLMSFVVASESGRSFFSEGEVWDAWGRSATRDRVDDLTGYAGRVVGDEVEILASDATRVEGDPEVPDGEQYPLPARPFGDGITVEQFFTLSSSGPIWRMFDAQLVVEEGVGRICPVDEVVDPTGCPDAGMVIDTQVRSGNADLTSWYGSPILAFQDPVRGFTHVIPLAGYSSRNERLGIDTGDAFVTSIRIGCGGPDGSLVMANVGLEMPERATRTLTVVEDGQELGNGTTSGSGQVVIGFGLTEVPGENAELVVTDGDIEYARIPIPAETVTSCATSEAAPWEPPSESGRDDDVPFRVVSRPIGGSGGGWIGWAADQAQLDSLLTLFDRVGTGDPIDYESEIALLVSIDGGTCGPFFDGLDLVDGHVQVRTFSDPEDGCRLPLDHEATVLALPRSELSGTTSIAADATSSPTIVEFATDSGRFLAIGDAGFQVTNAQIDCRNTGQLQLTILGHGDGVESMAVEARIGERPLPDATSPSVNPADGALLASVAIPDGVVLDEPITFTVDPAGSTGGLLESPPISPDALGPLPSSCR
ncbi:hypothetical protein BDK89_2843 [Ilumatobacter fluminis]|uniref:Uncharacterized protein n=1 Tax=Ilumatobacter fluminis TaxID=467091 RepID=A0A4R7I1D4_9ACTN|nr:hypothetical protein [Ilumatobacter fluminis]TDT17235.1 hypothetical protein BDK89_2843 [Ilumatobacter fluminis]